MTSRLRVVAAVLVLVGSVPIWSQLNERSAAADTFNVGSCPIDPADVAGLTVTTASIPSSLSLPSFLSVPAGASVFGTGEIGNGAVFTIGPSGDTCSAQYGNASGGLSVSVNAPGASTPSLFFDHNPGGVGPNTDLACAYIPAVHDADVQFRGTNDCQAPPSTDTVSQVDTATQSTYAAVVTAPSGAPDQGLPTSASSVGTTVGVFVALVYQSDQTSPEQASAEEADCTLPSTMEEVCAAALKLFVSESLLSDMGIAPDTTAPSLAAAATDKAIDAATHTTGGGRRLDPFPPSAIPAVTIDADKDGLDDNFEQSMADKWAPMIFIEPDESNYPVNVGWLLDRMQLQYREDGCTPDHVVTLTTAAPPPAPSSSSSPPAHPPPTPQPPPPSQVPLVPHDETTLVGPTLDQPWTHPNDFPGEGVTACNSDKAIALSTTNSFPDGTDNKGVGDRQTWQLFFPGGPDDTTKVGSLDPRDWVTYVHVYPSHDGGVMVQYWHVFAFNQLDKDDHEGDWDASLQVQLDSQLNLVGAYFSRHNNDKPGRFIPASALSLFAGSHVEEAIDGGGHGAYASPQDWCSNPDTAAGVHGSIVWPGTTSDPQAKDLHHQKCPLPSRNLGDPDPAGGGTVWETWEGGTVFQGGAGLTHQIVASPSIPGTLDNVGECNPGSPGNPGRQAAALGQDGRQGSCNTLNDQHFIQYSGQWGSTRFTVPFVGTVASPRGPVYQGFDTATGIYQSWYNQGADVPYQPRPPPAAAIDGPIQRIVFVHGINANCNTIARGGQDYGDDLVQSLARSLNAEVDIFCYDHDLGYSKDPTNPSPGPFDRNCGDDIHWSATPDHIEPLRETHNLVTDTDTAPLSVSAPPGTQNLCDGNGPLAYDSTRLEDYLFDLYQQDLHNGGTPRTTAVIGNSMGGAITRGWLQVAAWRQSPTLAMVSTVLFIQGALEGSYIAAAGHALPTPIRLDTTYIAGLANLDPNRPGVADLAPQSDWYQSVILDSPPLPHLHYYSVYTDITVHLQTHVGLATIDDGTLDVGDGVMASGEPAPRSFPADGGARLLPYGTATDQHEYEIHHDQTADALNPISIAGAVVGDPGSHFSLGSHIGGVQITSCASGNATVSVPDETERLFTNPAAGCAP